jgi:predicted HTH domain antitoxin
MTIVIPDQLAEAAQLDEKQVKQQLALRLYDTKVLGLYEARLLAEMTELEFYNLMKVNNIYINYDLEELKYDLEALPFIFPAK